ncbi:uncharacterized protein LOC132760043 [Ruditapes philippinarum]|uniref:uncharacterized protein LOC132760043 n=1 Tax=Ruditapes philippinarum TaxID=129788 RepID=UPI00295B2718|nr:uncharacterized protein LOC132760043 [Ruditapes philippinarum]
MDSNQSKGSDIARMIWIVGSPLIFAVGVFGNIVTMIILSRKRNKPSSTTVFLSAKAFADLFVILFMLPRWWLVYLVGFDVRHIHNIVCKLQFFGNYFNGSYGSFLLAAVTIERALCTAKPYMVKNICTANIAVIISIALALTSCVIHGHMLIGMKLYEVTYNETAGTISFPLDSNERSTNTSAFIFDQYFDTANSTTEEWTDDLFAKIESNEEFTSINKIKVCWYDDPEYGQYFSEIHQTLSVTTFMFIPLIIFLVCGIVIIKGLRKSSKLQKSMRNKYTQISSKQSAFDDRASQITFTLLLVNGLFVVMALPALIFLIGRSAWVDEETGMTETQEIVWALVNMLIYLKHAINFILYFLSGNRFRRQVLELFGYKKNSSVERSKGAHANQLISVSSNYDLSLQK